MHLWRKRGVLFLLTVLLCGAGSAAKADSVVVFNEIMYYPGANTAGGEWLELHNQMAVDVDLSGWSIAGGVAFTFAEGTVIPGGGYLVVAQSPAELGAATGLTNVLGPYSGHLAHSGEKLDLYNRNQRLMDSVSYAVGGNWPVGPDGSGVSLAKQDEDTASGLAANWTVSALVGGSPGRINFPLAPYAVTNTTPLLLDSPWKYAASGQDLGSSWRQLTFDDSSWPAGAGAFQAGSVTVPLGNWERLPTVFNSGVDANGAVLAPGSADPHYWLTLSAQSKPPPPAIPATVIQNHPAWAANDAASSWLGPVNPGTANVAAGDYNYRTTFSLSGYDPASAVITASTAADNRLTNVFLNGISQRISWVGYASFSPTFTLANGLLAGTNTLDFFSVNDDGPGPNPAGFRVELSGTGRRSLASRTTLPAGPTNYYFRAQFALAGAPQFATLQLQTVVADGAVFYLNGTEVLRLNLPAGLITASTFALTNVPNPAYLGPYALPSSALVSGANVLAVEVHPAAGANHLLFAASLALSVTNVLVPPPTPLAFNEVSSAGSDNFWFELINYGSTEVNLAGCVLARRGSGTNNDYAFPAQTLGPGGLAQVTQATLGFGVSAGDRLFLYGPGGSNILDALVAPSVLAARWPDGAGAWAYPSVATPGASNAFVFHRDVIINEIMYCAPVLGFAEAWVELFNRGSATVDLTGWALGGGIQYSFAPGTTLSAGGYLVVANQVAHLQSEYPGITVVGPFTGKLSHRDDSIILTDAAGNTANQVHYFDSRPWPEYPHGGGSSLELRDPLADNSRPEAWGASVESGRSYWSNYTYRAVAANNLGPTQWNEFVMGLLDAGECLIADLHVVESPDTAPVELLQNGSFTNGLAAWRALGDHGGSRVEMETPTGQVLHLIATGPTDHMHNHLETTYANGRSITDGKTYQISFRAKWLAGNNNLNTRLYFNRVAQTTRLPMPTLHGTPGAPNSVYATDIGPTFASVTQLPAVPQPNAPVTVIVSASDPQGVSSMNLRWAVNGGPWQTAPMSLQGPAAIPGYSNYGAVVPGQPAAALVQFYAQATDGLGAASTFPAGGADSRALFKVDDGTALMTQLHRFRLLMTAADTALLHAPTNVMSNGRLGATVVYDERQVFHDVEIKLSGSERGRDQPSRVGFSLKLHPDQLLRGVQSTFTLSRDGGFSGLGGEHDELLVWAAVNHAGGLLGLDWDLAQVFAPQAAQNGPARLRMADFNGEYFDNQFKNGGNGNLYDMELIYYPTTTLTGNPQSPKLPEPDNVINIDVQNWGSNPENYRWIFIQQNNADADDYSQLIAVNQAFSQAGGGNLAPLSALLDTDEYLRTLAFLAFTGDPDTYMEGLNHNWKFYFRPQDGKALGVLWNEDYSFVLPLDTPFPGTGSPNTHRFITYPDNYRRYYTHLLDMLTTTFTSAYLGPWATRYARLLGQDWSGVVNYLQQRANFIRSTMPLTTAFAITTHAGQGFSTSNNPVSLAGTAPLTVKDIWINGVPYGVTWLSLTNWTLTVSLLNYTNLLAVQGFDNYGAPLPNATAAIIVTNLGAPPLRPVVVNEWMASNTGPTGFADPVDGEFSGWFELYNPNGSAVDLSGFYLTDDLSNPTRCQVPAHTVIPPFGFLLVWADNQTSLNGSGPNGDLHVSFNLAESGGTIALFAANGTLQNTVTFGAQLNNVSQGLFPDGNTNAILFMPNWTPRASNQTGLPPPPRLAGVTLQPDGSLAFQVTATPWRTYSLEFTEDLAAPAWTQLGANQTATGSTLAVTDSLLSRPRRFYRLVLLP